MAKPLAKTGAGRAAASLPWVAWANDDPTAEGWALYDAGTESTLPTFYPKGGEVIGVTQPLYRFTKRMPYSSSGNDATVWLVEVRLFSGGGVLFSATSDPGRNEVAHPLATPLTPGVRYQWRYTDQTYYPDTPAAQSGWIDFEVSAEAVTLNIPKRADLFSAFAARPVGQRGFPASLVHYQAGGHSRDHYTAMATGQNGLASFVGASLASQTDQNGASQLEASRILKCAWLYAADANASALTEGLRRLRSMLAWSTGKYAPTNIVVTGSTGVGDGIATITFPTATRYAVGITTNVAIEGASNATLNSSGRVLMMSSTTVGTFPVPVGVTNGTYTATMTRCTSLSHLSDDPGRFKLIALFYGTCAFWGSLTQADKDAYRDHLGYMLSMTLEPSGYASWGVPLWVQAFANSYMGRGPWDRGDFLGHIHEWMAVLCAGAASQAGLAAEFTASHFGLATNLPVFCAAASVLLHRHYASNTDMGGNWEGAAYHGFMGYFSPGIDFLVNALGISDAFWTQPRWQKAAELAAFQMRKSSGPRLADGDDHYAVSSPQFAVTIASKTASPYLPAILQSQGWNINALDSDPNWPFVHLNVPNVDTGTVHTAPAHKRLWTDALETVWSATSDPYNPDAPSVLVNVRRRGRWNHGNGGAGGFQAAANGRRLLIAAYSLPGSVGITDQHKTNWANSSRSHNCWALNGLLGTQVDGANTGSQNRSIPLRSFEGEHSGYLQLDLSKAYRKASYVHTAAVRTLLWFSPGLLLIVDRAAWGTSYTFEWCFHTPAAPSSAGVGSPINLFGVTSTSATRTVDAVAGAVLTPIAGAAIVAPTAQLITDSAWPSGTAPPANAILNSAYPESPDGTLADANHVYWHNYVQWAASTGVVAPMRLEMGSNRVSGEVASVSGGVFTYSAQYGGRNIGFSLHLTTNVISNFVG